MLHIPKFMELEQKITLSIASNLAPAATSNFTIAVHLFDEALSKEVAPSCDHNSQNI